MSYNSAISIHALREEGDARTRAIMCLTFTFLSTPSARRATTAYQRQTCSDTDFYPRPPRGGRPLALSLEPCDQLISIHALREEGDANTAKQRVDFFISIHALREEGDFRWLSFVRCVIYFYPRPPRGGRRRLVDAKGISG